MASFLKAVSLVVLWQGGGGLGEAPGCFADGAEPDLAYGGTKLQSQGSLSPPWQQCCTCYREAHVLAVLLVPLAGRAEVAALMPPWWPARFGLCFGGAFAACRRGCAN